MPGHRLTLTSLALLAAIAVPLLAEKRVPASDVTNFALESELSQWLVGPVAKIATAREISEYLAIDSDAEARAFIERFWERRTPTGSLWLEEAPRTLFEARAEEADRLFTEGVTLGRRTSRGEIHVLYGPPKEVKYETNRDLSRYPIEIWEYGRKAEKGLDGKRPKPRYRFVERDGSTVPLGQARDRPGDPWQRSTQ